MADLIHIRAEILQIFSIDMYFLKMVLATHLCPALFNDLTRDSIANNFVIGVYCRCLQILYQITFFYKI